MNQQQSGSSVLIVMVVMGILAALFFGVLQQSILMRQFAQQRVTSERLSWYAQGLLDYGVAFAQANFDVLRERQKPEKLEIIDEAQQSTISIEPDGTGLAITCVVGQRDKPSIWLRCRLVQNLEKKMVIECFQR